MVSLLDLEKSDYVPAHLVSGNEQGLGGLARGWKKAGKSNNGFTQLLRKNCECINKSCLKRREKRERLVNLLSYSDVGRLTV